MTDSEVEEGAKIELTNRQLFTDRCYQYLKMLELDAPDMITDEQERMIVDVAGVLTGREFALAMRDFASDFARFRRIEKQVAEEHPPDP